MLNCKFCNKECKNKNSLAQHECRCRENPNKIETPIGLTTRNIAPWNKGLTKETSEILYRISLKLQNNPNKGRAKTAEKEQERKNKISITMKKK